MLEIQGHTRGHYDNDLQKSISLVNTMGELVVKQLQDAISLFSKDGDVSEEAEKIILRDKKVNALETAIYDASVLIITKYQPKGQDLRLVLSIFRAASDLERIGDTVSKICNTAKLSNQVIPKLIEKLHDYANKVINLLNITLKALDDMDLDTAVEVYKEDHALDQVYLEIYDNLVESIKQNPQHSKEYISAIITLKQIERIGDRCKNICEFIYYYATGENSKDFFY